MKVDKTIYMPKVLFNTSENNHNKNISIDDFMKILAAELSNQSFLGGDNSSNNTDYISQLVQLTNLEQINGIKEDLNILNSMSQHQYAFSLLGKEVKIENLNNPNSLEDQVTGVVDKVKFKQGYAVLEVNGNDYPVGLVLEVSNKKSDAY